MEKNESLFNKFRQFINKDVPDANEPIQFYVMLRIVYLITAFYFVVFMMFSISGAMSPYVPALMMWVFLHVFGFFATYRMRRRALFHIFSMDLCIWVFFAIHLMGWGYGAQHFLYLTLVISFFATYQNTRGKAIYTACLCLFRLMLFEYSVQHEPVIALSESTGFLLQSFNTITIFLCMFVICLIFSNTNQAALEKLAMNNEKLKEEAETDALTRLMNRRCMYRELENSVQNHNGECFSIAMGDIDFFKKINDTLGHNFGDYVLQELSAYFREYMEGKGIVCRWGGEEFLFLFTGQNGDEAFMHVENMRHHIEAMPITCKEETVHITMTFGVEEYDFQSPVTVLIKRADDKLYTGKENGRNQVVF